MSVEFEPISPDEVAELAASRRSGYSTEAMQAFIDSGESAADFSNSFPGKKLANVANALKRLTQRSEYSSVRVIFVNRDGQERLVLTRNA